MPPALRPYLKPPTNHTIEEEFHLETLLSHKLRGIPRYHIPSLTPTDILHRTPLTHLPHIPADINLAFLLRNRDTIDSFASSPLKDELGQEINITRAIFFYRLSPTHQFQRYHDAVRWNIAIFTALLTQAYLAQDYLAQHSRNQQAHSRHEQVKKANKDVEVQAKLSPAAVRFMTLYLSAVLEHHSSPTIFTARESFIRLYRTSPYDLFAIHRSWAKKALQREMKRLSKEWGREVDGKRREMRGEEYDGKVAPFVGSIVPGQNSPTPHFPWAHEERLNSGGGEAADGHVAMDGVGVGNELLDALGVCCRMLEQTSEENTKESEDEGGSMVCDLRTAVSCVQSVRPKDMLGVLMRMFPPAENE